MIELVSYCLGKLTVSQAMACPVGYQDGILKKKEDETEMSSEKGCVTVCDNALNSIRMFPLGPRPKKSSTLPFHLTSDFGAGRHKDPF